MAMNVKGITWAGDIYEKFENMCLEVEDNMFEDTVKYIENQMQTVGESVKKIYSDVMQDLLPPSSCDLDKEVGSELPVDKYTDAGFCKKSFQGSEKITEKADTKYTAKDSRIKHDATHAKSSDADALFKSASGNSVKGNNLFSHARQYVGSTDIKSNLGSDENQENKDIPVSNTVSEITLLESDACSTSQSCELSNENQNHAVIVSKPASAEITRLASVAVADHCNEIENASTEQISNVLVLVKSAEEKEINMSYSSSSDHFGVPDGFSMIRTIQSDDCSHNRTIVSHPEIPEAESLDASKVDAVIDHGHKTMQQDDELKLEETCVMVTRDELQLVLKTRGDLKTNKKKKRQPFSLSKKSARKQEYEELAIWHGNNEKVKGDCVENLCPTLLEDQNKLLLPDISEPEWELL